MTIYLRSAAWFLGAVFLLLSLPSGYVRAIPVFTPVTAVSVADTFGQTATTTLPVGASIGLVATVAPPDASNPSVAWSSSNAAIASVDPTTGVLTAVAAGGPITITATGNDTTNGTITGTYNVTVVAPGPDYSVIFGDIKTTLAGQGITTNIETCASTPTACSGLYFEKTGKGRVTFTAALDLTDAATVSFLQSLGSYMDAATGSMKFDATTATQLKNAGAQIKMYGLDTFGYATSVAPSITVKDDSGTVIDGSGIVSGATYDPSSGTLTFTAAHFTQFEVPRYAPTFEHSYDLGAGANADLALDSSGNLYVVFEDGGSVYLKKNLESAELVHVGSAPVLSIDASNNVHVLFSDSGLQYMKKTGGTWSAERAVPGGTVFYSMDTDSTGAAHVVSDDGGIGGRGHLVYVQDTGDAWSSPLWEATGWYDSGSGAYYHLPVIRIDGNDKYHIAYEADGWGGRASWSSRAINITTNAASGDSGVGGFDWNAGVGLNKNGLSLDGSTAYLAYTNGGTLNLAKVDASWSVLQSVSGSAAATSFGNGLFGTSYSASGVAYVQYSGTGFSDAVVIDAAGSNPSTALAGSYRFVVYEKSGHIWLASNKLLVAPHTLTYAAGANGSISGASPQSVSNGADGTAVSAVADDGYHFTSWSDGSTDNPRTDTAVTHDISVTASFEVNPPITHTITASAGDHGSISPSGTVSVGDGADASFTISPAKDYHVADVLVDDVSIGAVTDHTFSAVKTDHTISATFAINDARSFSTEGAMHRSIMTEFGEVTFDMPSGETITGPLSWEYGVDDPAMAVSYAAPTPDVGYDSAHAAIALEVGAGDTPLTFSKAVKITFVGQAGKYVGWSRGGVFHAITNTCDSNAFDTNINDGQTFPDASDCKISNDGEGNLIVWTKHYTTFVTYTQSVDESRPPTGGGGGGSGSGGGNGPIYGSLGGTTLGSTAGIGGQVLGASTSSNPVSSSDTRFQFTKNMGYGSRLSPDVSELQKVLIAEGFLKIEAPTGYFGPLTKAAVIKYQQAHGVQPTSGYVGPLTRAQLNK